MGDYINLNGKILKNERVSISPDNRSFRYGDGLFETMRFTNGKIVLGDYHFERLFSSLDKMLFTIPKMLSSANLVEQITELVARNQHPLARVRCTFYRGEGGLYDAVDHRANYIIQTWDLSPATNVFNENGLILDFYKDARKVADQFSSIKSNNFLPYAMGALFAKKNKLNDCILLNPYDHIADATIANVFIVKDGLVQTPLLTDGPVNGVMRRHIINCIKQEGIPFEEKSLEVEDVLQASEVFLTNAINGIKWVKQVAHSSYTNQLSQRLHGKFVKPLFFEGTTF